MPFWATSSSLAPNCKRASLPDACFPTTSRSRIYGVHSFVPQRPFTILFLTECHLFVRTVNMPGRTSRTSRTGSGGAGPSQRKRSRRVMEDASVGNGEMEVVAVAEARSSLQYSSVRLTQPATSEDSLLMLCFTAGVETSPHLRCEGRDRTPTFWSDEVSTWSRPRR